MLKKNITFAGLNIIVNQIVFSSMEWIVFGIASFLATYLLMPPFIRLMEKHKLLDKSGGRKIHTGYTAHMGGVVIFVSSLIAILLGVFIADCYENIWKILAFVILMCLVLLVGVRDDMNNLTPKTKLLCEIGVGFLLCYVGVRIHSFYGLFGVYEIPVWLSYILSIIFMVVVSNAYNLIDGIDGQAGTQALSFFVFMLLIFIFVFNKNAVLSYNDNFANSSFWLLVSIVMIGALLGFLVFNWQPAKIFMGDTGSLFIGFLLAICMLTMMDYNGENTNTVCSLKIKSNLLFIVMLFFLPLADTLRVFIYRVRRGKSPFSPDKTHIHHLFFRVGYQHKQIALTTLSIQVVISLISIAMAFVLKDIYYILYIIGMWFVFVFSLRYYIRYKTKKLRIKH